MAIHNPWNGLVKRGGILCHVLCLGTFGFSGQIMAEDSVVDAQPVPILSASPMDLLFPVERLKTTSLSFQASKWSSFDPTLMAIYPQEEENNEGDEGDAGDEISETEDETEFASPIGEHISAWRLEAQGGLFLNRQWNPTLGVGLLRLKGNAVGRYSLDVSEETSDMWILPLSLSMVYRFDYSWDQLLVPYAGVGGDGWVWREETSYARTSGVKWGVHGVVGGIIRLDFMETSGRWSSVGRGSPSDVGLLIEASYAWVDGFGAGGLDFSGPSMSAGIFFSF